MRIFTFATTLLLSAMTITAAHAQDRCELFGDTVNVNRNTQFHVFIKSYSQPVKDYLTKAKRIAIEYESDDTNLITLGGAWFQPTAKEGTATMKLIVYQESATQKDQPDYAHKLDSLDFIVKIQPKGTKVALPYVNVNWGTSKAEAIADMEKHYSLYSDTYYAMNPSITQAERQQFDWFLNPNFDYPLLALGYNDDGQLFSSNIIVADGTRIGFQNTSEISDYLTAEGYELLGYDEMGLLVCYNETNHTQVSAGYITIQGQYFRFLNFQYMDQNPLAVEKIEATKPLARIVRSGSTVSIDAEGDAGQQVSIFTLDGKLVGQGRLANGKNTFNVGDKGIVVVRVGKHAGVKLM